MPGRERIVSVALAAVLASALSCSAPGRAYRWDMDAYPGDSQTNELVRRRVIVRGMTEAQVRYLWGAPRERAEMPPSYSSLTYWTSEEWITVVFERGRVARVDVVSRASAAGMTGSTRTGAVSE